MKTEEEASIKDLTLNRKDFDVEKHNNKLFIYTSEWNDEGDKVWCANTISETELRRIVENMHRFI